MSRFLQAEINLSNLIHNLSKIKAYLSNTKPSCKIIAIVKADAYGHGAVEIARICESLRVDYLGVAFCEEAIILREAGIKLPIIVLFDREIDGIFKYNLIPVIFDYRQAESLSREAIRRRVILPVHIKVETGMGRLGIYENIYETIKKISELKNLKVEGIMSHLSRAEEIEFTNEQLRRFMKIRDFSKNLGINPLFHIANSQGLNYKEALFDAVRPGLLLYGYGVDGFIPCMTVKTKLLDIRRLPKGTPISYGGTFITNRESLIGVIPVGYADGYFRSLSNKAEVIVRGKRARVVGVVCMDLTMVDLTDIKEVKIDDEVILLGKCDNQEITALHIAEWAGTIPYEVLTSFGGRARRKYIYLEGER